MYIPWQQNVSQFIATVPVCPMMSKRRGRTDNPAARQPDVFVTGVSNAAFQGSANDVNGADSGPMRY